jgi:hypothetical protein
MKTGGVTLPISPPPITRRSVDISLKGDVTVFLLLGVSFMVPNEQESLHIIIRGSATTGVSTYCIKGKVQQKVFSVEAE